MTIVIWLAAVQFAAADAHQDTCVPQVLPTLGGPNTLAFAINNRGQVVGTSTITDASGQSIGQHAFVWEQGNMRQLATFPNSHISVANGLNDSGTIVGTALPTGVPDPIPVIWTRNSIAKLPLLAGTTGGDATAINNRGQIVGVVGNTHCVLWKDARSQPIELPGLGGAQCTPHAINDQGLIVGEATAPDGSDHAVSWRDGRLTDLSGTLQFSGALDVNNAGQTVGVASDAVNETHPTEWIGSRPPTVFGVPGFARSNNDRNDIAAATNVQSLDARLLVIDRNHSIHDIGAAGGLPADFRINDGREAVWTASTADGVFHSYFCQINL
jgi:probable HAF family extracellular repeat protein